MKAAQENPSFFYSPEAGPRTSNSARKGRYILRQQAVRLVAQELARAKVPGLLIKGYGLATTLYQKPWQRDMADVDILVPSERWSLAVEKLRDCFGAASVPECGQRPYSKRWLGEQSVLVGLGPATILVEIHNSIDKVSPRPIPFDKLYQRATAPSNLANGLRIPDKEDQLLLTVAHLGNSHFQHELGWTDLKKLFEDGCHWPTVMNRSNLYRLNSCLYFCLEGLCLRGVAVDPSLLQRLKPGVLRRRLAHQVFEIGKAPPYGRNRPTGLRWVGEQTLLRDDPAWLIGITRYATIRLIERIQP